jgi:uncharacterized protein
MPPDARSLPMTADAVGLRTPLPVVAQGATTSARRTARPSVLPGQERAWEPEAFHVLTKPTGAACNLGCSYCFFLDKEVLYPDQPLRMSDDMLETYLTQLVAAHRTADVAVAWQGGEPTLMGLDFFRRAARIQAQLAVDGARFHNTIQTNGTLLDDEWCAFLAEHGYLVGISIDGPRQLHDAFRVDKGGHPTFDRVLRGLRLLQEHQVETNVLTTVNAVNGAYPRAVYRFLRDDAGADWMQFIPVVERLDDEGDPSIYQRGTTVSHRSVGGAQYGRFLSEVFDEWVRHDVGTVFVQTFEATLRNFMGLPSTMCVFDETCGTAVALEHNGDLYSCDHFVDPDHQLGNIAEVPMGDLVGSRRQRDFGQAKHDTLPRYCRECDVRFACNGECPKNRFLVTPDGEPGLNYLCEGLKSFFHHVDEPMRYLASCLRTGRPAGSVMRFVADRDAVLARAVAAAGRNEPCPCGSGRKTKHCHDVVSAEARLPDRIAPDRPRPRRAAR